MKVVHITILCCLVIAALSVKGQEDDEQADGYFEFMNQALEKRRPARTRPSRCLTYGQKCTVNYFGAHNCCFQTRCTGARGMPCSRGKSCVCAHYNGK